MAKLRFTAEQYQKARYESSALEYAVSQGYEVKKEAGGRYFRLSQNDSLVFGADGHFWWNSRGINGGAIEFIMYYEEKTLPEAVITLCDGICREDYRRRVNTTQESEEEKTEFVLPPKAKEYRRMFSYLLKTRALNYEVVRDLVKDKKLYESQYTTSDGKSYSNAVFVGYDKNGRAANAFQRSCSSYSSFKKEVAGSDKVAAPFTIEGGEQAKTLYVFEAAIDAASHASLYQNCGLDYKQSHRLATGGNSSAKSILNYLKTHPKIEKIVLCFDNDNAGVNLEKKFSGELLKEIGGKIKIDVVSPPIGKDWNEYLVHWEEMIAEEARIEKSLNSPNELCIHITDGGSIVATKTYSDKGEFLTAAKEALDSGKAVVIQTPEQTQPYRRALEQAQSNDLDNSDEPEYGE